jgi:hypothetical protein
MLEKIKAVEKKKIKAFSAHPSAAKRIDYVAGGIGSADKNGRQIRDARFEQLAPDR